MNTKKIWVILLLIGLVFTSAIQGIGSQTNDITTLEIIDIRGGICSVTADIQNTGSQTAESFLITISVQGGQFNNIDIVQECSGCTNCSTTIPAGEIKSESTLESGMIIGFGSVDIVVTAEAANADVVTTEANGFVFGPLVLIM